MGAPITEPSARQTGATSAHYHHQHQSRYWIAMRFPLFSRLSHLINRRPKSESFATDVLKQLALDLAEDEEQLAQLPRSRSFDSSSDNRNPFILPPHLLDILPQNPIPSSFDDILVVLANLEHRIPLLETENAQLKENNNRIAFESQLREQEIHLKKAQVVRQRAYLTQLQNEVEQAQRQLDEKRAINRALEDFLIKTLASYPPTHVFHRIAVAIDAGSSFENAVVNTIREEIETTPHSPWSKLVPAVVGPRTPDQYASALGVVLRARRDLIHGKNVSRYWKRQAQLDDANADVITPSSSILSDVQEPLNEERQRAVNELLQKLRTGEIPVRSRVVTQAALVEEEGSEVSSPVPHSPLLNPDLGVTAFDEEVVPTSKEDLNRLSTATLPPLSAKSLLETLVRHSDEVQEVPAVINLSNPMAPSSTTRSLAGAAVSISSLSSSSLSTSASADLPEIWEFASPVSLSQTLAKKATSSNGPLSWHPPEKTGDISSFSIPPTPNSRPLSWYPPQDTGDISSIPVPPTPTSRPLRPVPRINPFSGLETIDETEEPSSASSSSDCLSSVPSSLGAEILPDNTLVDASIQNEVTLVHDEPEEEQKGKSPSVEKGKDPIVVVAPQESEVAAKAKSPKLPSMSMLPRRLSLLLRKPGKVKEVVKEQAKGKEEARERKEKEKKQGVSKKEVKSLARPTFQSRPALAPRKEAEPSQIPPPRPTRRAPPPPPDLAKLKTVARVRANSGASTRPTISSTLKQANVTPPRRKVVNKENVRDAHEGASPTKPRVMKMQGRGSAKGDRVSRKMVF
ncbi:hypothetical protein V5O48_013597 [Marasmius crinis-equi]|uniref:Uncharacterized protein n=1 Tax=Marasmius crinis-equi TaxID=585013 RepID=A0ABR3EZM5_9AGAR